MARETGTVGTGAPGAGTPCASARGVKAVRVAALILALGLAAHGAEADAKGADPRATAGPSAAEAGAEEKDPGPSAAEDADVRNLGLDDLRRLEAALAAAPDSLPLRMDRLRVLYVLSVRDERLAGEGERELERLRPLAPREAAPLLQAYRGAFRVLDAKHSAWPPRKLEHLKAGLPTLDSAVSARPDEAEIRYLRLVSCYYLPFFIGRGQSVKDDFAALARLLPEAHRDYPARWYLGFARFVLEKGSLEEDRRRALEASVARVEGAESPGKGRPR